MLQSLQMATKRVNYNIRLDPEKVWKIKENAVKARMGLGEYIENAGTIAEPEKIRQAVDSIGVPPAK